MHCHLKCHLLELTNCSQGKEIKNERKPYENISPPAIPAHQSPLWYMVQRQQDLENVLFNNAAEILLNPTWNTGNLSCSQKPNCQMVSLQQGHSTLGRSGEDLL